MNYAKISLTDGTEKRVGVIASAANVVAHRDLRGSGYTVTHAPSGMSVAKGLTRDCAVGLTSVLGGDDARTLESAIAGDRPSARRMVTIVRAYR